jgi:hypothetical protein
MFSYFDNLDTRLRNGGIQNGFQGKITISNPEAFEGVN